MIAFGFFVILILFDSLLYFQVRVRQALFIVFGGFFAYEILKAAKELFYHLRMENFSSRLSVKEPDISKHIGPAMNFILTPEYKTKGASQVFIDEHLAQTGAKIRNSENIKFSAFDFKNFKNKLIGGVCLALCFSCIWIRNPLSTQRMVLPFSGDEFENILTISPQNATVVENESVLIKVSWKKKLNIIPVLQIKEKGGGWVSVNWDNENLFDREYNIFRLKNAIRYRLKYRSMKSRVYRLKVRKYPQIKDIRFIVNRPDYFANKKNIYSYIPARISVLEGSEILFKAASSERASEIVLRIKSASDYKKINLLKNGKDNFLAAISVYENMNLEFEMLADDGLMNPQKIFQKLDIIKDLPPSADILSPLFEIEMPSGGGIKIVYHAKDDFGLSGISLRSEIRFKGKADKKHDVLKELKVFGRKNIKEFIGDTYVFFPNLASDADADAWFYLRVFDDFPAGGSDFRWTESAPVKVKIKNFYKNHIKALAGLSEMKSNFARMLKAEKKEAFNISQGSASFKASDFLKRWKKFKNLSKEALSNLNRDPYFNAGLKNEYETLHEDISHMSEVRAKKVVQEFNGRNYEKAAGAQESMTSFLKRGLNKMDELLKAQTAKDFEFKAEDWEHSLSKIEKALSRESSGKPDEKLWEDLSKIMKSLAQEMGSLGKMLGNREYRESFGEKKRFQIPIDKALSLADKLRKALKSRNLKEALSAAKALLEEIRKTRRVFSEYSDFVSSMQGGAGKMKKLKEIKKLWDELRDNEEETFSKNTVFTDELVSKINLKRKEVLKQLIELSTQIQTSSTTGVEINFIGELSATPVVEEVIKWREGLKRNIGVLKKESELLKNSEIKKLMEEMNFSLVLSSGIENDLRFFDLSDKTFFTGSANLQKRIIADARKLKGDIDNAKEEFLKFSVKAQKHLSKAIAEMKKAFSALNVRDMDKALKHQLKALEELDSLGDTINESMRKQKNLSASKKRGLSGPKTFGSPSVGAGGAGGLNKSGVKLPKEGAYRSSREIREKVMESLKEKYPKKSKETIVDYLRKISQ